MITVDLATAVICFAAQCFPALVGADTPKGTWTLTPRIVLSEGYGGDVLQVHETGDKVYAIHRVWLGRPAERREHRLRSGTNHRVGVTAGCINVDPTVYGHLKACCLDQPLIIK
jgi:hypothetical protein